MAAAGTADDAPAAVEGGGGGEGVVVGGESDAVVAVAADGADAAGAARDDASDDGADVDDDGAAADDDDDDDDASSDEAPHEGDHALSCTWTFWYRAKGKEKDRDEYEASIKEVGSFATIEGFWSLYSHLLRPNNIANGSDYNLFRRGIKPIWEDAANRDGGKWIIRLRQGSANRVWEDLLVGLLSGQIDTAELNVSGVVCSRRYHQDVFSIWVGGSTQRVQQRVREQLRRALRLPSGIPIEFKRHQENSGYRPTGGGGGGGGGQRRGGRGNHHHHHGGLGGR